MCSTWTHDWLNSAVTDELVDDITNRMTNLSLDSPHEPMDTNDSGTASEIDMTGRQIWQQPKQKVVIDGLNALKTSDLARLTSEKVADIVSQTVFPMITNSFSDAEVHIVLKKVTLRDNVELCTVLAVMLGVYSSVFEDADITLHICENSPDKARDDRLVLILAHQLGAIPISDDQFRDCGRHWDQPVRFRIVPLKSAYAAFFDSNWMDASNLKPADRYRMGFQSFNPSVQTAQADSRYDMYNRRDLRQSISTFTY